MPFLIQVHNRSLLVHLHFAFNVTKYLKLTEKSCNHRVVCVCVHALHSSTFSMILLAVLYLSKNSPFQRLQIIHMNLGRFNPSGGRFGMGCRTGTYFSTTSLCLRRSGAKPCSGVSTNRCSMAMRPSVDRVFRMLV